MIREEPGRRDRGRRDKGRRGNRDDGKGRTGEREEAKKVEGHGWNDGGRIGQCIDLFLPSPSPPSS
eukprot:5416909-Pyramimonas_sp.AAC.1